MWSVVALVVAMALIVQCLLIASFLKSCLIPVTNNRGLCNDNMKIDDCDLAIQSKYLKLQY